ncbi:MAG TPA: triple tyrosine motif-containing protein, partial [Phaeodactylibacter sp.]|nr:triple tyrosine motif-containing protein [Phaeodactylibacter sp.]
EDAKGLLWITTFEGISRLNPATMAIQNFDFRTPQHANQFNQSALLAADNGRLFFGGTNGLNTISPKQLNAASFRGKVILTDFKIFNQTVLAGQEVDGRVVLERPIEEAERIQLSYLDKSFSFRFSAIDYTNPGDYQYSFIMEGFDDHWQETEAGQNQVSYTNLDPGDYTFKVRYQEQMASIDVHIQPPFWRTPWFRVSMILFGIGLVVVGIYIILKRKEAAHNRALLRLKNEKLAAEIDAKTSKLMFSTVQMAHKNEILTGLKDDLLKIQQQSGAPLGRMVRKLDAELRNEDHWKDFDIYFNQVDQDFFQSLLIKHPALTQNDLRLCSLIRINLSTKEIAFLLNISTRAVEQGRYRLKKRLELSKEEDLNKYITGFKTVG